MSISLDVRATRVTKRSFASRAMHTCSSAASRTHASHEKLYEVQYQVNLRHI